MKGVTFSSLDRVMACPASAVLPPTREVSPPSEWSRRGTVIHNYLRDCNRLGQQEALTRVPLEHLEACEGIDLSQMPVDGEAYAAEVALAYDWQRDVGREINRGSDSRDYGAAPTEVAGRTDVVALSPDAVVHILDYKTGYRYLGRAEESWQLKGYALAAARAYGMREASVSFVRVTESGQPWYIRAKLGYLELEETALALTTQAETVSRLIAEGGAHKPELLEGHIREGLGWCKYCPAFWECPAKHRRMRTMAARAQHSIDTPPTTRALAAEALRDLRLDEQLNRRRREALEEFSRAAAIPVLDGDAETGLVFGPIATPREEFDAIRGAAVLGARFGPDVATAAVENRPRLTKASVERAMRAWMANNPGQGHRITKLREAAIEALRRGGAAVIRRHTEYREHRPDIPTDESAAAALGGEA